MYHAGHPMILKTSLAWRLAPSQHLKVQIRASEDGHAIHGYRVKGSGDMGGKHGGHYIYRAWPSVHTLRKQASSEARLPIGCSAQTMTRLANLGAHLPVDAAGNHKARSQSGLFGHANAGLPTRRMQQSPSYVPRLPVGCSEVTEWTHDDQTCSPT